MAGRIRVTQFHKYFAVTDLPCRWHYSILCFASVQGINPPVIRSAIRYADWVAGVSCKIPDGTIQLEAFGFGEAIHRFKGEIRSFEILTIRLLVAKGRVDA